MDQVKIGKLIAQCRKENGLTQAELANLLGVTDKSVSKWENGVCLPNVSLCRELCEILGITLNEFFSGERLTDESFKEAADSNLLNALENSVFTVKDRIDFFKKKWQREHFFELTLMMIVIVAFIIYGFVKDNGLQYLFMLLGFVSSVMENNRMMAYIEKHAYGQSSDVSVDEVGSAIQKIKALKGVIAKFQSRNEAVEFLMRETGLSKKECKDVYDFVMKI